MRVSECLTPVGRTEVASRYLARLWVPGRGRFEGWQTADWWLDNVGTVEDAIHWTREHSKESPGELMLLDTSGVLIRIWGSEPHDSRTAFTIDLTSD